MVQDALQIKDRIFSFIKLRGPSLPIHVSKDLGITTLFSSAFLSELVSDKRIKISNMRVGSSPIYFLDGQESALEKFSQYLKSREKDAFQLLKEKGFLKDSDQQPAIRVALREIKDFALPLRNKEEIFWRYFLVPESEFKPEEVKLIKAVIKPIEEKPVIIEAKKEEIKELSTEKPKRKERKTIKKKASGKGDKFLSNIKEFLSQNSIELVDIESFGKKEIVLKVRDNEGEKILVAYDKNKISENDIINASKRASGFGLPYIVLGLGEPLKKLENLIEALKSLSSIKKVK
ncbi:MAG: hypothetical protein AABX50_00955 [Nanoarchaeota archaeon]